MVTLSFSCRLNIEGDEVNPEKTTSERRKSVKFSDGIMPGEGTSPSGGEELSSPPPPTFKKSDKKLRKKLKSIKKKSTKKKKVKVYSELQNLNGVEILNLYF